MLLAMNEPRPFSDFSEWGRGWADPEIRWQRLAGKKTGRRKRKWRSRSRQQQPVPAAATGRLHHCQRETSRDTGEEAKKVMLCKVGSRIDLVGVIVLSSKFIWPVRFYSLECSKNLSERSEGFFSPMKICFVIVLML